MITAEVAKRIRAEHFALHALVDELKAETAVLPRTNLAPWLSRVSDRFDHLRAHLVKHMALEEEDGYLSPVVERRPALTDEVERLHHQHGELLRLMGAMHLELEGIGSEDRLLIREFCRRVESFLELVERHEDDEALLMLDGVVREIGTKD